MHGADATTEVPLVLAFHCYAGDIASRVTKEWALLKQQFTETYCNILKRRLFTFVK